MTDKFNEVQQAVLNNKKLVTVLVIVVFIVVFFFREPLCNPSGRFYEFLQDVCNAMGA